MTVLDHILSLFKQAGIYNRHDLSRPAVILWTDGDRHWEGVVSLIARAREGMFRLADEMNGEDQGPSTWIRYQLGEYTGGDIPVVYLPGIHRHQFRSPAGFPESARHLYALQYQGQFCTQQNGKDWTPVALLASSDGGLGLDVARDRSTSAAVAAQLEAVLRTPVRDLHGRHLEASDFHRLAVADPVRLLFDWMSAPDTAKADWPDGQWSALLDFAKKSLGLDPEKDGLLVAAEKLAAAEGKWSAVWARFEEAAHSLPGVVAALETVQPADLFDRRNLRLPATNRRMEDELRESLRGLETMGPADAADALAKLEETHAPRVATLWAALGRAPLATALSRMVRMRAAMQAGSSGTNPEAMARCYLEHGWQVDAEARAAWNAVRRTGDGVAVKAALGALYRPWLEGLAEALQAHALEYPARDPSKAAEILPEPGTVVVFVDGLRADVAMELNEALKAAGLEGSTRPVWSALPTVTATAKPAWRPMAARLDGREASPDYEPLLRDSAKPLRTTEFRNLLPACGWQWLEPAQTGDPSGSAWTEAGALDSRGHKEGAKLAWRIGEEVALVQQRVLELVDAGWRKIRIVTDHGWLWLPGGLPKVELPKHLTVSKWGRCARPSPQAHHNLPQVPWFWGNEHPIVMAPGIGVFHKGVEYTHGGLTLQEALTLTIEVEAPAAPVGERCAITACKWMGLKLTVEVSPPAPDLRLDIRTKAADPASSIFKDNSGQTDKAPDATGKLTLFVEDDDRFGEAAVLVLLRGGNVIAKTNLTIGEN